MLVTFWWLVIGHFVADYTLQPDFVAAMKSRKNNLAAVPWYYVLTSHTMTHGAMVALVTGSVAAGTAEVVAHWVIDALKCEGLTGIHVDQFLHLLCKAAWVALIVGGVF